MKATNVGSHYSGPTGDFAMRRANLTVSMATTGVLFALLCLLWSKTAMAEAGVYVMNADGGGKRRVVSVAAATAHLSPRWSHDGKRLAFEVIDDRDVRKSFVVNLDGTELKMIAELGRPDWSPDDKQLILDNDDWNSSAIFVHNIDGGGRMRLTEGAWPRWSRDGSRIAFCDKTTLKVLDLEKGDEQLLYEGVFLQRPGRSIGRAMASAWRFSHARSREGRESFISSMPTGPARISSLAIVGPAWSALTSPGRPTINS